MAVESLRGHGAVFDWIPPIAHDLDDINGPGGRAAALHTLPPTCAAPRDKIVCTVQNDA